MAKIVLIAIIVILLIKILFNPNIDYINDRYILIWYTPLFNRLKRNCIRINV